MMEDCARFIKCNAMVCPLDADWRKRVHLQGERVCIYLIEYYKEQGSVDNIPEFICGALDLIAENIMLKYSDIRRKVCVSSELPSRITQFKNKIGLKEHTI